MNTQCCALTFMKYILFSVYSSSSNDLELVHSCCGSTAGAFLLFPYHKLSYPAGGFLGLISECYW